MKHGNFDRSGLTAKELKDRIEAKGFDFDKQLKTGIEIEMEHAGDKKIARVIALDHLTEYPDYYVHLKSYERSLTKW